MWWQKYIAVKCEFDLPLSNMGPMKLMNNRGDSTAPGGTHNLASKSCLRKLSFSIILIRDFGKVDSSDFTNGPKKSVGPAQTEGVFQIPQFDRAHSLSFLI